MDNFDRHRGGDRYSNSGGEEPHHYSLSSRHSRGGGPPFHQQRPRNSRGEGGGGNSPHDFRGGGFSGGGGGRGGGREGYRPFSSPPRFPQPPRGDRGVGGGGLRPIDDGIEGFRRPVGGGEGFGPMGVSGGRGFPPTGGGGVGGGIRQMDGDSGGPVDEFQQKGGSAGRGFGSVVERSYSGEGFRPMGGVPSQSMGSGGIDGGNFQPMGVTGNEGGALGPMVGGRDAGRFQPIGGGGSGSDGERYGFDNYHMPPPPLTGQKRGYPFSGREKSPDRGGGGFAKLFVGSVPRTATDEDIRPLFEKHGCVLEVALIKDKRTGQQQGCCFVKYASSEEADRAIRALHNQYTLPGGVGPIQVRYADGERERLGASEYKLFVGSLNRQSTEKEVEEIFSAYGRVEDVYIMRDEMKQSRGCGFVKYSQREMAQAAINGLNGAYTMRGCNQPLIVRFADPKRPRPGESRGAPGPGFGPQFSSPGIRPPLDHGDSMHGSIPSWPSKTPHNLGPPSNVGSHGFGNQFPGGSGVMAASATQVPTGGLPGNADGSLTGSNVSSAPTLQMNLNQPLPQGPSIVSKISPAQRPLQSPQNLPSFVHLQGSHMQPGQMQMPQPAGQALYSGPPSSQQLLGRNGQLPVSHPQIQHHEPSTPGQAPGMANQQLPPGQQLQPLSQSPSQLAQMLSQQKQTLQATFQSSQQTLNQLQQQVQQLQPSNKNLTTHQGSVATRQQSAWAGTLSQPVIGSHGVQPGQDLAAMTSLLSNVPAVTPASAAVTCNWTEHTSPDGYKYYYNGVTGESKWEKPDELTLYEQQQQQQQQKPSNQQPQVQSHPAGPLTQQTPQMQVQFQGHQSQLHNQPKPLQQSSQSSYQVPGLQAKQVASKHQELVYSQIPTGSGSVNNDPTQYQQGAHAVQEWMWKNKHSGTGT